MKCSMYARWMMVGLAALIISPLLFGGGQQAEPEELTLDVIFRVFTAHEPESEVELELEEVLGFKINFDARPSSEYVQITQTILASGDYPDMMEAWFADAESEIRALAEDKVVAALDDLLDEYGPNIYEARPFEENWYRPLPDGKTYSIPARFNGYGFEEGWLIRQDYLDALGMSVPTTLEEFRQVAHAMTFNDPNGSGRQDTYGFSGGWPVQARTSLFKYILGAYGVLMGHWQEVDGELVNWALNPATLDALKFMREMYLDGVVDPEFALQQRPAWLDNMRAGRYGMQWWWNTHLDANASEWWAEFLRNQPDARVSFIPPAPGPSGERLLAGGGVRIRNPALLVFESAPQANQVAAIRLIDYLGSEEGAMLGAFGIEGKHYDWNPDGSLESYVAGSEEQARAGTYRFGWIFRRNNVIPTSALAKENIDFYQDYVVRPVFEMQVPAQTEFGGVLLELQQSRFLRIQTERGINADAEWADYVRTYLNAGGQEINRQMNAAWRASQ